MYYPEDQNHYQFWKNIYWLTQYEEFPRDSIRNMARAEHYRRHPEELEIIVSVMDRLVWHDVGHCVLNREYVQNLERQVAERELQLSAAQARLARIEGSRLYRLYRKARPLWSRWLRK